jgi:hypothetical protein
MRTSIVGAAAMLTLLLGAGPARSHNENDTKQKAGIGWTVAGN